MQTIIFKSRKWNGIRVGAAKAAITGLVWFRNKRAGFNRNPFFAGKHPSMTLLFFAGAVLLAVEPALWLVKTWFDPALSSNGSLIFLLAAGVFAYSVSSPLKRDCPGRVQKTLYLLYATALVRILGRLLAVNMLGALALVVDVYALGLAAGLKYRERPVSPFWLALIFFFSLPLERAVLRTAGFLLQQVSAAGAATILTVFFEQVSREGIRILLDGRDVLVDLPCSGARGFLQISLLFALISAFARPGFKHLVTGLALAGAGALVSNTVRISLLAVGLAYPKAVGVDVMGEPWHDLIGYACLVLGMAPLLFWARGLRSRKDEGLFKGTGIRFRGVPASRMAMVLFALLALGVFLVPARPVDGSSVSSIPVLPQSLAGFAGKHVPLSPMEKSYFATFGGGAAKADYEGHRLLAVRTQSPLRHLHAPDECLTGSGHRVRLAGRRAEPLPSAVYESRSPEGDSYQVLVTFMSDRGRVCTSVSEAVWRWFGDRKETWTLIERIHPAGTGEAEIRDFDLAVARALDAPLSFSTDNLK